MFGSNGNIFNRRQRSKSGAKEKVCTESISDKNTNRTTSSTIKEFIRSELQPQTVQLLREENFEESLKGAELDLEQITNVLKVPFQIEQLFLFTLLTCLNCFLHYFTLVPIRIFYALVIKRDGVRRIRQELLTVAMIMGPSLILNTLDTSKVYHKIKGQNAIKLYMIFQVLDMVEKLLSSAGLDLYSILMVTKDKKSKKELLPLYAACCLCLMFHALVYIYQILAMNVAVNSYSNSLWTLLLSMQFAELKAAVFKRIDKEGLFQLIISDIVERFQLILFLTVIAVRNFVAAGNNWSNVLPHSWSIHSTKSLILGVFVGPILTVIGSEIVVDWLKHAYVIKFNRIRAHIYERYLQIISKDNMKNSIQFQKRLGLPFPPLIISFLVLIWPAGRQLIRGRILWAVFGVLFGFVWLLLTKITLQLLLVRWTKYIQSKSHNMPGDTLYIEGVLSSGKGMMDEDARRMIHTSQKNDSHSKLSDPIKLTPPGSPTISGIDRRPSLPPSLNDQRNKKDLKHPRSLEGVERYKMVSKRIW